MEGKRATLHESDRRALPQRQERMIRVGGPEDETFRYRVISDGGSLASFSARLAGGSSFPPVDAKSTAVVVLSSVFVYKHIGGGHLPPHPSLLLGSPGGPSPPSLPQAPPGPPPTRLVPLSRRPLSQSLHLSNGPWMRMAGSPGSTTPPHHLLNATTCTTTIKSVARALARARARTHARTHAHGSDETWDWACLFPCAHSQTVKTPRLAVSPKWHGRLVISSGATFFLLHLYLLRAQGPQCRFGLVCPFALVSTLVGTTPHSFFSSFPSTPILPILPILGLRSISSILHHCTKPFSRLPRASLSASCKLHCIFTRPSHDAATKNTIQPYYYWPLESHTVSGYQHNQDTGRTTSIRSAPHRPLVGPLRLESTSITSTPQPPPPPEKNTDCHQNLQDFLPRL